MKIHIMGASCAGSTTLGNTLAGLWGYTYLDTDAYFWQPSDVPFTVRRTFQERNELLKQELKKHENVIVGGSLINWGQDWQTFFDLVVFLYVPPAVRMKRLKDRELAKYASALTEDALRKEKYHQFITWASGYDDNTTPGRNLGAHQDWLRALPCETLEIYGDTSVQERISLIAGKLDKQA
jgi:adenylate kinase family enzyme